VSLQDKLKGFISNFIEDMISETLLGHIRDHGEEETRKQIQYVFQKLVDNDISFLDWVNTNKPHWLKYLKRVKRISRFIDWRPEEYIQRITEVLEGEGITITEKEKNWLRKTFDELEVEIFGR
jgi:hypothetical protein